MRFFSLSLLISVSILGCSKEPKSEYLGQVNGRKIYLDQIEERYALEIRSLQERIRQIKVQGFSTEAEKILIAEASAKIGETPETYLAFFKGIERLPVTEAEIKKYEEDFGRAVKLLPKEERDKIAQSIRDKRFDEARKNLIESLKRRATIQQAL